MLIENFFIIFIFKCYHLDLLVNHSFHFPTKATAFWVFLELKCGKTKLSICTTSSMPCIRMANQMKLCSSIWEALAHAHMHKQANTLN